MMRRRLVGALACASTLLGACGAPAASPGDLLTGSAPASVAQTSPTPTSDVTPSPGPQPGLVDIGDGRSLWMECEGDGSPTVILESGMGGDHRTWEHVQPAVADEVRVCTYDRAGIGESTPAPGTRTAADAVSDLQRLLEVAEIEPPYVLVGFSWGGAIAQLYAATHPDSIAGLVLVESNHPREAEQFEAHLTPEQIDVDRKMALDNPEAVDPQASFAELQAAGPLPDVPLVVVTAGRPAEWPPGWDSATFDALRAEQQADLVTFTSRGRQIVAEDSGHHVPSEQPEVIIEAIRSVLADVTSGD